MRIIALSGWKGSGKDTVAAYLERAHGFKRVSFADPLKDRVSEQFGIARTSLDDPNLKEQPLLKLPVNPRDRYSRMIAEFMFKEFRSSNGTQPCGFEYRNGEFYGLFPVDPRTGAPVEATNNNSITEGYRLYWTPRALAILEGSTKRCADTHHWVKQAVAKMEPNGLYVISDLRYKSELDALNSAAPNSVIAVRIERWEKSPSDDPSERDLDDYPFPFQLDNRRLDEGAFKTLYSQIDALLKAKGLLRGKEEEANSTQSAAS
jgi:hypothetical protein